MSKMIRFPEINRPRLTKTDSTVIDIYQSAKFSSAIGKRASWFTDMLISLGNRFVAGDMTLIADVQYMHITQQLMG